jgi:hypothetical protein
MASISPFLGFFERRKSQDGYFGAEQVREHGEEGGDYSSSNKTVEHWNALLLF